MNAKLKQFAISAVVACLATTAGYIIGPTEVRFISSLTDNPALVGMVYAAGALFFAFLSVWLGRLSDRFGRNKFILIGCALGVVYPIMYASVYNVFQYMGVKFIWAFSAVATGPVFMAHMQDLLKDSKKKAEYIGWLFSAQSVLGSGAALLGGYLSDRFGLVAPYFAMALIFLLATIISIRQMGFKNTYSPPKNAKKRDLLFGIRYIIKKPALRFYFFHNTAFSLNWGIKIMLWPLIIFSMAGMDIVTGRIFASMGIVACFVLFFAGKFVDRHGAFISSIISLFILGICGLFLVFTQNIYLFWLFAVLYAVGEALNGHSQAVLLTENIETKYRGEILGLDAVFDNVFGMISPFMAGVLLNFLAPQNVLLIYISFFWVAQVICYIIYKKNKL